MAVAFVKGDWTAGTSAGTELTVSATAGNMLVVFIAKTNTTTPVVEDDKDGTTGWTVNATKAVSNASANGLWMATKKAKGTETKVTCAGAQGIAYLEISGSSEVIDTIENSDNVASGKANTSAAYTNTDSGGMVIVGVGDGASASGVVEAWGGTGPKLENPVTTTARVWAGYKAPGEVVSAKTFTTNHVTARPVGMIVVTFKPATEVETKTVTAHVTGAGAATAPSMKVATPSAIVTGAGRTTASASKLALVTARVTGAGNATVTIAAPTETKVVTALVHGAGRATVTALGVRLATALVHGGGAASAVTRKVAVAVGRVTGGGAVTVKASRVASTTAKVSGGGLARATVSKTALVTALVHGGGTVTVTLRPPAIIARVTGGGGATVSVSYFVPEAHFPIKAPIPGHVAVSQRGRLNRNKGHLAIPNAGRSGT